MGVEAGLREAARAGRLLQKRLQRARMLPSQTRLLPAPLLFPLRRTKADTVGWAIVMASGKMQDINAAVVHRGVSCVGWE